MSLNLWLLQWLLSARALFVVEPEQALQAAQEDILGAKFWVLRDPARPSVTPAQARQRHAIGYRVLLEVGLESELPDWLRTVDEVLADPRGWQGIGREFVRVESNARFSVLLARPSTIDLLCAPLRTGGVLSCGRKGRAALNLTRWREGTPTWGDDVEGYHLYMINHEVGHLLGMPHQRCPEAGGPAAVMQQQTIELDGCTPHGWPSPTEVERLRAMRASWGR
ncbi:putative membrane protein [Enhygromyxa salina]|uniref:Putative membrane protein n=1 Tax=Enhygromyxa salina TaxID=215803 RepID=A0A0C2CUU7_9BACT|nr:DUF3152 domain-containing protein [Enhygromyxa salina]KIG14896.1 putative membrane protein [Enhygromyxa salina]